MLKPPIKLNVSQNELILPNRPEVKHPLFNKLQMIVCLLSAKNFALRTYARMDKKSFCRLRPDTQKQYQSYLKRWNTYCTENKVSALCPKVEQVIEFLTILYRNWLGYSSINTARSSLSSIIFQENDYLLRNTPLFVDF